MSAQMPPDDTLDGLWAFDGQQDVLDDDLAKTKMGLKGDQPGPFHGTYTRQCYHYVVLRSGLPKPDAPPVPVGPPRGWKMGDPMWNPYPYPAPPPVNNFTLEIFDEEGNFSHAEWNDTLQWGKGEDEIGAWEFSYNAITVEVPATATATPTPTPTPTPIPGIVRVTATAGNTGPVDYPSVKAAGNRHLPKGDKLVLTPSLVLTPGASREKDTRFPRNGTDDTTPCPLPFFSDGPASPPSQYIYYDSGASKLVWVRPDVNLSLNFTKLNAPLSDSKMDPWRSIFTTAGIQWSFPFVGWNPKELPPVDDPVDARYITNSGTGTNIKTSDGQPLDGHPIFAVPDLESQKWNKYTLEKHSYAYPWGAILYPLEMGQESTHTQMVSSTHELVDSWTMTLGLSAGIEKLVSASVKGSYHDKVTSQQENETRYSVTRRIKTHFYVLTDIPNLQLDPEFSNRIWDNLKKLNNGDSRGWDDFVKTYGTHYIRALTYGETDFAEMRFSLQSEVTAHEQGWKLEEKASAMLEGIKFGEDAGVGHDWSTKDGLKLSNEDVTHKTIGAPDQPAAIFLDLRPIWELFSPVFFPPNLTQSAPPEGIAAPFIWTKLRSDFKNYLTNTFGVNQPLDKSYEVDFTPHFIKVSVPEFKIWTPNQAPCIYGDVGLMPTNDGVEMVSGNNWQVNHGDSKEFGNGSDNLPGIDQVFATFAVTPKGFASEGGYKLNASLYNYHTQTSTRDPMPNVGVTRRFRDGDKDGVEWHDGNGWGFKITFTLENV